MTPSSADPTHAARPWPDAEVVTSRSAVVATTDRYASEVGLEALRTGGNAVDAAVAVSFALAVVNPEAGNIGGGGFMLVRPGAGAPGGATGAGAPGGATAALDFRTTAPAAAGPDMFLGPDGEVDDDRARFGHLAVAVPGSVRGVWDAWERFGTRPWAELVQPAVELAGGFEVTERFTRSFPDHIVEGLRRFERSAEIFLPGGRPPVLGETFRQDDLANTLARVRDRGPDGFYRGPVADLIVAEMGRGGGLVTHDDLTGYRTVWREPLSFQYGDRTVVSMPPPSSGGVALAQICHMLRGFDPGALEWHSAEHVHLMAETWRRAFADRNHYLADPGFSDLPAALLASPGYGAWRASSLATDRATPSAEVRPGVEAFREGDHTTHVSIVDGDGMAVALTTTINTWYGSKLVAEGTGVLLNNDMDDFTARPGAPNHFGLVQGAVNAVAPGKRPLSAMTPTLVLDPDGRLELVVGSPGGATIITTVFQVISNLLDHGMSPGDAVSAARVHHQHLPDEIRYEPAGLSDEVIAALREMGHRVVVRDEPSGDVQMVRVRADGTLEGVADPRRGGVATGL